MIEFDSNVYIYQVGQLTNETEQLPARSQLAAGFITYLGCQPEDIRRKYLNKWCQMVGIEDFDLKKFLSSESEQLVWKGEGLPSDVLSMDNALVILKVRKGFCCVNGSSFKYTLYMKLLDIINKEN